MLFLLSLLKCVIVFVFSVLCVGVCVWLFVLLMCMCDVMCCVWMLYLMVCVMVFVMM